MKIFSDEELVLLKEQIVEFGFTFVQESDLITIGLEKIVAIEGVNYKAGKIFTFDNNPPAKVDETAKTLLLKTIKNVFQKFNKWNGEPEV